MRILAFVVALLTAAPALAQPQDARATVVTEAPIFIQPGAKVPLRVAKVGTALRILQEEGAWAQVEFNDPQFGRRVGWIEKQFIRISRAASPADVPASDPRDPAAEPVEAEPPPAAFTGRSGRAWIDVNLGIAASAQQSLDAEVNFSDGAGEFETYRVGYRSPAGASFDVGGGYMFTPRFGAGIQLTGTAHRETADLSIRIPHPRFFNAHAEDSAPTDEALERAEGAINLSFVVGIPTRNPALSVRVFGGPTRFRLEADAIDDIGYFQEFAFATPANEVTITSWSSSKVALTTWGFHAGGDVGYFFNRYVGIGGFARLTRGTVTFSPDQFLVDEDLDVRVGGFQAGGGLRLRF